MKIYTLAITVFILSVACPAENGPPSALLPAIETYITEPLAIENVSIWVPADKSGPYINNSCRAKHDLTLSSALPATVNHQKSEGCPEAIARILAEQTSYYHAQWLPLTIFNGWQWENTYNISQYESASYDLAQRGGSWETSWEAVLNVSCGSFSIRKMNIESLEKYHMQKTVSGESRIDVKTFTSMRTRDGYPKERQLQ